MKIAKSDLFGTAGLLWGVWFFIEAFVLKQDYELSLTLSLLLLSVAIILSEIEELSKPKTNE